MPHFPHSHILGGKSGVTQWLKSRSRRVAVQHPNSKHSSLNAGCG
jgi:hypothetical protein